MTTQGINLRRSRHHRALKNLGGGLTRLLKTLADRRPSSEFVNSKMNPKIGTVIEIGIAKAIKQLRKG